MKREERIAVSSDPKRRNPGWYPVVRVGTGFEERRVQLADMKPGWVVSVTTRHKDGREVAEVVRIVFER